MNPKDQLSPEQIDQLRGWAEDGVSLGDIQKQLETEFEMKLTFLDTRFLLGDLGISLKAEEPPKEKEPEEPPATEEPIPTEAPATDPAPEALAEGAPEPDAPAPAGTGKVTLTTDTVTVPGSVISGSVTFSDGKSMRWYLDQMGRLGMDPPEPGYKPPENDIPAFQTELDNALKKAGY